MADNEQIEELDNEPVDSEEEETELSADEPTEAEPENIIDEEGKKRKGKSRNQRLSAKVARLEKELEEERAHRLVRDQYMQPNMTQPQMQQDNQMQQPIQQQAFDPNMAMQQVQQQQWANKLENLRNDDDKVDDILNDMNHPLMQIAQQSPAVVAALPSVGLDPDRLFEIANKFPNDLKKLRRAAPERQLTELLRLDGRLQALHHNRQEQLKSVPEPTGVLKGNSSKVEGKRSLKEEAARLREKMYSG